jgi:hypothetical protein
MKAKDAMHKSVDWVSPDTAVIEARKNDARVSGPSSAIRRQPIYYRNGSRALRPIFDGRTKGQCAPWPRPSPTLLIVSLRESPNEADNVVCHRRRRSFVLVVENIEAQAHCLSSSNRARRDPVPYDYS